MNRTLKHVEKALRRFLLLSLRLLSRRKQAAPSPTNFNNVKILFIRQDRIGDVLISTPIFSSLKQHYPGIVIDVFLSRNNHFVLAHNPLVRNRWIYTKRFLSSLRTLRAIRSEQYDFVVDLMDNPSATSTVLMLLAKGKWNAGLDKENAYACDIVIPLKSRKDCHIVERIAQLLTVFGIDPEGEDLRIRHRVASHSEEEVTAYLKSIGKESSLLTGVNISAGSDTRFWGIENYQELVQWLVRQYPDRSVVMLSKPADRNRLFELTNGNPGVIVAPETSFDTFAAWISRLSMLISPDTSAVHLAAAFQIPSVILYVQSDPDLRIWEPYKTECEPLITKINDLTTIPVREVANAVERLMNRSAHLPIRQEGTVRQSV